ncbi:MAG TPA: hypothetical protein VGO68_14145, partial [Pyrinomonadaceae bacterium]|nr:hypothetical protein [Pyrinomonadaceae bacterium]
LRIVKPLDLTGYSRHTTNPPNDSVKRGRELAEPSRRPSVKACGPTRFLVGATRKHNQKMHGEKRLAAHFIMHVHGGKLLKTLL